MINEMMIEGFGSSPKALQKTNDNIMTFLFRNNLRTDRHSFSTPPALHDSIYNPSHRSVYFFYLICLRPTYTSLITPTVVINTGIHTRKDRAGAIFTGNLQRIDAL